MHESSNQELALALFTITFVYITRLASKSYNTWTKSALQHLSKQHHGEQGRTAQSLAVVDNHRGMRKVTIKRGWCGYQGDAVWYEGLEKTVVGSISCSCASGLCGVVKHLPPQHAARSRGAPSGPPPWAAAPGASEEQHKRSRLPAQMCPSGSAGAAAPVPPGPCWPGRRAHRGCRAARRSAAGRPSRPAPCGARQWGCEHVETAAAQWSV